MKALSILIATSLTIANLPAQDTTSAVRDTMYYLPPVTINPAEARERETPATFSNLSAGQIQERYSVQDIPELLSGLPSITFYSEGGNGIGYNYINLRGFDQRRLSVMVNGIPQNDPEDHNVYWIDLPDLLASTENIQVQRGAGSGFYGPPAIGGSVNLISSPFNMNPSITLESLFGFQEFGETTSLNTRKYAATVNSGLVDRQYIFYGRLGKILTDGYRENSWVELNSYFLGAVRFDENMTTRMHFFGGPLTDGLAYYGLPKFVNDSTVLRRQNLSYWETDSSGSMYTYTQTRRAQEIENFSQPHYELLNEWRMTPAVTLANTFFYYTGDGFFDYDASWADTSMLRMGTAYGVPASENPGNTLVRAYVGNRQGGWLPRIELDHGSGNLILGTEFRIHRSTHWGKIQYAEKLPPGYDPEYHFYEYNGEKDIFSFYVHELYRASAHMNILADIQFVHNRYGITNEKFLGNNFQKSYFFANPRLGINYNVDERINAYLSAGYTSREPRLRNLYAAEDSYFGATPQFTADTSGGMIAYDYTNPLAKPEHLLDIELGFGVRGDAGHLALNVYWMEFTDELVKNGQVDIFGQPVTGNAERTRHMGIEFEGAYGILDRLTFSGNASFSRNRFVRSAVIENGIPTSLDDNPIAGFPGALANMRLTYHDECISASLSGKFVGEFYTDNFQKNSHRNDSYIVADAGVLYRLPRTLGVQLTIRGEVRNVLNNLYFSSGEGNAFFPAAERNYLIGITTNL